MVHGTTPTRAFTRCLIRFFLPALLLAATNVACRTAKPVPHSPRTGEASVRPGVNDRFKKGDVDKWVRRFEAESREIYVERDRIVDDVGVKPGMIIADIGAGTGFITELFAQRVRPGGKVYAVEISQGFLDLIRARAKEHQVDNIETILCSDDSVELPSDSIDIAFICDTYHHFEYPRSVVATIHDALKPGGEMVIIDFIREEGKSSAWIMKHVRADKSAVIREIEADGFRLTDDGDEVSYLTENYMLRFRKTE